MSVRTFLTALLVLGFALPASAQMSPEEAMRLMQKKREAAAASTASAPKSDANNDARWKELVADEDAYLIVPLAGEVLPRWTDTVKIALDRAAQAGVKHVVFVIDSPGGLVDEAESLAKLLQERDAQFETYAVVRRGISASIWPMFSCDHIYVTRGAMVGGALTFRVGATGAAQVDDKMNSVYAAHVASIAERKGHPAALARGMMLPDAQVYASGEGENAKVTNDSESGARRVKDRGAVLTLTADEAVRLGLADRRIDSLAELGEANGLKGWHCVGMVDPGLAEDLRMAEGLRRYNEALRKAIQDEGVRPDANFSRMLERLKTLGETLERAAMSDPSWHPRLMDEEAKVHRVPSLLAWRRDVRESGAARRDAHRLLGLAERSLDAALATVGERRDASESEAERKAWVERQQTRGVELLKLQREDVAGLGAVEADRALTMELAKE